MSLKLKVPDIGVKKKRKRMRKKNSLEWYKVCRYWVTENLQPDREKPYTFKDCAQAWKINYGSLRNVAHRDNWKGELQKALDEKNTQVLEVVKQDTAVEEGEVRIRQARVARLALAKATVRLQAIEPGDLSVREALELLKLGFEQERKALGLADKYEFTTPDDELEESVVEQMGNHKKLMALASALLTYTEGDDPELIEDGDFHEVKN